MALRRTLAANSDAVIMPAAAIQPALVLVEDPVGAMDGQVTCSAIRLLPAADPETLPVVLISGRTPIAVGQPTRG